MEGLLRKDIADVAEMVMVSDANRDGATAAKNIAVQLRSEDGVLELEVYSGESVLVRLLGVYPRVVSGLVLRKP